MDKDLLSILIPTYNRAQIIDLQLSYLVELLNYANFEIIICDNCSTDNTSIIVSDWQAKCNRIKYFCQAENVGYDRNVYKCVGLVETDFFWILGDSTIISLTEFKEIIAVLKVDNPHAILINAYEKLANIPSKYYSDADSILRDLGWNITHLSSLIISKNAFIDSNFKRYFDTNFLHLGVFFEYIVTVADLKVFYYHKNPLIHARVFCPQIARTSWAKNKYEIFGRDWFFFILSLPNQIQNDSKLKCILDHSNYNKFFSYERIIRDRAKNYIDKKRFANIQKIFPFISETPVFFVKLMNFVPRSIFLIFKKSI